MADRKLFTKTLRPKTKKSKIDLVKIDHPVLRQTTVTPKKLPRYLEKVLAAFAPYMVPEAIQGLREQASDGSIKAQELVLKLFGLIQTSGINVIQQNNNSAMTEAPPHRSIDAFYRERGIERGKVIEAKAIECQPLSLPTTHPLPAGSETQESQS